MRRKRLVKKGHLDARDRRHLERAFALAVEWHARQLRKGTAIPYLSHLVQVAGLVLEHGGAVEQASAAFLHDALEDAPNAAERAARERIIRRTLGPEVLRIVLDCTDTEPDESMQGKRPWKARKQRYVAHVAKAPAASVLVSLCDKRHNLGTIVADVREHGIASLDRFTGAPAQQLWYYRAVLRAAGARAPRKLRAEMRALIGELARAVGKAGARGRSEDA